jgi:NADPH2:quinone reductase
MPQRIGRALSDMFVGGKIKPLVGATYPLERVADALREIEERRATGKIALIVREP